MKITKYFLSMAAAVGMIAACQKTEMVQIAAPENVVAPVLEAVEGAIEITPSNLGLEKAAFTWSLADFGVKTQVNYSLEAAAAANSDAKVVIVSGITADTEALEAGSITFEVEYEKLNAILFNDLKLNDGVAENVLFTIGAKVGEYAPVYSNAITVSCKVTAAEKQYPKLYVVGSYNGWSHDKNQYLFDFAGTDAVYQGMVDFGEDHAANEFKITGGGWGNDEHSMDGAHDAESKTIALVAGGGDNINVYQAKRFYHLTFDRALTLTADFSFDQLGVIGDFNGWGADVVMEFNASKQRFYADVEVAADGGFKFRADAGWDVNWGVKDGVLEAGADNIAVTAGNYRVYVNMNNLGEMTYELNAGMFGKEEPTAGSTTPENPEPEPTPVVGWSLIGAFNGWAGDLMLASDGTYYFVKGAELEGELKFRKDGDWAVNFGLAEGAEFAANAEIAVAQDGPNFNVPTGTYDVYLDEANAKAWFITDGSYPGGEEAPEASEWGVVGVVNNWGGSPDVVMFKTATEGLFVAKNVAMPDGGFKIRANNAWVDTANYGLAAAGPVEVDHVYDLVCAGSSGDMTLVAGNYDIWFDLTNSKVYIMTPGKPISEAVGGTTPEPEPEPEPTDLTWYLVGNFNGWTVADAAYTMTKEGDWFVFKGFVADGDGFKFNAGSWDINRGATGEVEPFELAANTEYEIVANGKNFSIAAGTYDVYMSLDAAKVYVMAEGLTPGQTPGEEPEQPEEPEFEGVASEWGVVGVVNNWGASADIVMYTTPTEGLFVAKNAEMPDGAFKIRANNEWNDAKNYGFAAAGTAAVDHAYDLICGGGSKDINLVAGTYDIYFDLNNSKVYVMTPGKAITEAEGGVVETPDASNWYLVGNFNGWATGDANYKFSKEGNWYVFKGFVADGQGVKFNAGSWDDNRGGTFSAANTAIAIAHNGSDMYVAAGTYDVYMNAATDTAYFMTPGTTPAN